MKSSAKQKIIVEDDRTGIDKDTLKRAFLDNLYYIQGRIPELATRNDYYMALAYTLRDRMLHRTLNVIREYIRKKCKLVAYLSAEFLMGPHLGNNLINLGLYEKFDEALRELGLNMKELLDQEEEPGLGNGGLGRLAACFLDSMATLDIPAIGYGIRYEFGIFDQLIKDGWQVEITDKWLKYGNPWEVPQINLSQIVKYGGRTRSYYDSKGRYCSEWIPDYIVIAVPYDTSVLGYGTSTAAVLRLWKAEASESFDFQRFNKGDYYGAVNDKVTSENISKVLYPNDEQVRGKSLRLEQQFFFTSASLQDMMRIHCTEDKGAVEMFYNSFTIQLNDTHPAIAVAELMRILLDEHHLDWDRAWSVTIRSINYTNHTLLPEALERWPVSLFGRILPRHLEIIYEINFHFLNQVREAFPDDDDRLSRMSIIQEGSEKYVRMANLACVGSSAINGVAALHTELLKSGILRDFYELWPHKFSNKTNGVTPRRWVVLNNQALTKLISDKIGTSWIKNLHELKNLEKYAKDPVFQKQWRTCKSDVKESLADHIFNQVGIEVDTDSMFDVLVKRIHEYKRQHLKVLHIITLYNRIKASPEADVVPRTFIFGGKAAPGYFMAKLIIKLINSVADVVNNDPDIGGKLKVVFMPNFNVKNSQHIYPAADLSEQISTAGKEASGTGNMKFTMNGALTIGTLDGANIEIREEVGEENFFLFGLKTEEVEELKASGYNPREYYESNQDLRKVLEMIRTGFFSPESPDLFKPLFDSLYYDDAYVLLADYQSYVDCQDEVANVYRNPAKWTEMSILNVARSGKFSSDRTIREYCRDIWKVEPIQVKIPEYNPKEQAKIKLTQPQK
ncbi:MAG: glycogen/starch/alpha-glucan phosphorylase [Cyclobacteriaceae bacterium]|nr:glycogen/starch/alpha-glucan phosphorylase [Cyclobacteriaceae bacterium]